MFSTHYIKGLRLKIKVRRTLSHTQSYRNWKQLSKKIKRQYKIAIVREHTEGEGNTIHSSEGSENVAWKRLP